MRFESGVSSFGTVAVTDAAGEAFHLDVGPIDTGVRYYMLSANDVAGGSPQINVVVTGPRPLA